MSKQGNKKYYYIESAKWQPPPNDPLPTPRELAYRGAKRKIGEIQYQEGFCRTSIALDQAE
ncbi:9358_t:CDS:2 [Funneliformis mosseae]|uniref:9358_t:CDS:1 n=1 Tax=Funneliformis mosseae TaxID=27381 RepID=A0A9N9AWC9_FUNMO|nr:9358_t:CDS:2 [Funneliformis mosseae]